MANKPRRVHSQDFNDWFALYGATATTEHLKPAASRAQKQDILRKVRRCPSSQEHSIQGLRVQRLHP